MRGGDGAGVQLEVRVLGPLEALVDGQQAVLSPRGRALRALRVQRSGDAVTVDRAIDALWGGSDVDDRSHTLRVHVSNVRKALGPAAGRLVTRGSTYVLQLAPEELDAARFES